eukprot:2917424-Prymnesium_polylepis.1
MATAPRSPRYGVCRVSSPRSRAAAGPSCCRPSIPGPNSRAATLHLVSCRSRGTPRPCRCTSSRGRWRTLATA